MERNMMNERRPEAEALVLVDYTVDFVAENGKLTAGAPAQAIEPVIESKLTSYAESALPIFIVNDLHFEGDEEHPEHRLFPPHNVAGTEGRNLYGNVEHLVQSIGNKKKGSLFRLDKVRYSAFHGTPLETILRQKEIRKIEIAGVCTDICVLHTAIDGYHRGFEAVIDEKAVASFNQPAHHIALEHMESVLGFSVKR